MENFEFRILEPVQQHVHARQVVGGDVLLLTEELAHTLPAHTAAYIE